MLFVIFINDLPENIQYEILSMQRTISVCARSDLLMTLRSYKQISIMPTTGVLNQFNFAKFVHLYLWAKDTLDHSVYNINGQPIKCSVQHKDLGVISMSDFNWTAHYTSISAKAYKTLGELAFKVTCTEVKKACTFY